MIRDVMGHLRTQETMPFPLGCGRVRKPSIILGHRFHNTWVPFAMNPQPSKGLRASISFSDTKPLNYPIIPVSISFSN